MNLRRYALLALATSACVLALASCGKSTSVTAANPVLDPAPPGAPSNLSATYVAAVGYDYLYWNMSSSPGAIGYEVWESSTQGGTAVKIASVFGASNYVVLPTVASDCTRYYEVRTLGTGGVYSAFSSAVAVDRHVIVATGGGGGTGTGSPNLRMTE